MNFSGMMKAFPGWKWMILILLLSSILPSIYFFKMYNPPDGYVFLGRHIDDEMNMAVAKSYLWEFNDPFILSGDASVLENPIPGPPYIMIAIGFLSLITGIELLTLIFFLIFIFSVFYLIIIYHLMGRFSGSMKERDLSFILFTIATGIGGIVYIIMTIFDVLPQQTLKFMVISSPIFVASIIYYIIPLAIGYISVICISNGWNLRSIFWANLSIGLVTIMYPFLGIMFLGIAVLYCIIKGMKISRLLPSIFFFAPWIYVYMESPIYNQFSGIASQEYYNIFAFILNGGFTLFFAAISLYIFVKNVHARPVSRDYLFMILWSLVMIALIFIPNPLIPKTRFSLLVWVPLSILASKGIIHVASVMKGKVSSVLVVLIILLSLPTIAMGFVVIYNYEYVYSTQNEFDALMFLKQQPQGNVISSFEIGNLIPYYSEKKSLRGERQESDEIKNDYFIFFSNSYNLSEKSGILEKYNITYVYFGVREQGISNFSFMPSEIGHLKKIYENNGTFLYKYINE